MHIIDLHSSTVNLLLISCNTSSLLWITLYSHDNEIQHEAFTAPWCQHNQVLLRRSVIISYRPEKVAQVTVARNRVRLGWARESLGRDCSQVIFTDKTSINIPFQRLQFNRRGHGAPVRPQHTTSHRPSVPKVMFWSCLSARATAPLVPVVGPINVNTLKLWKITSFHISIQIITVAWFSRQIMLHVTIHASLHRGLQIMTSVKYDGPHGMMTIHHLKTCGAS